MTSRRVVILSVTVFLALTGLIMVLSPQNMRKMQAGFLGVISPFLKTGSTMEKKYRDFREGLKTLEQLEEENKLLSVANKELSATNQTLRGLEAENNRLRKALGYNERAVFKLVPARIIAREDATWYNSVTIDRGSAEGLKDDMPVLTEEGLVGKTSVVTEHSAKVLLLADETCRVSAKIEGSPEKGIVKGERTTSGSMPQLSLNFLTKQANLQPGQKVFTSGLGGVFPGDVLIGAVREFKKRELDGYATIVPAVDLTTIEDVFVVVSTRK
ncbi:MAG TPA: rod shape-determining protein MreC [Chthoniobacteraceae bacterium]|jgi:rod shape-determining protein MreC